MQVSWAGGNVALNVAAELTHGPSGLAVAPDGSLIVALHQYFQTRERVVRLDRDGESTAFPTAEISARTNPNSQIALDSVMGLRCRDGIIWFLDNGRRGEQIPKLMGWNYNQKKLHRVYHLPNPVTLHTSFLADLAVDPAEPYVYIADPASGGDAAIIVLDTRTGGGRRVLQGHASVLPEDIPFMVDGRKLRARRQDGSGAEPLAGVNPVAVDRKGKFLYFGAMKGHRLYRVSTALLRDPEVTPEELAAGVEVYSDKPISDSIAIDHRDNIYVADVTRGAIQVITPKKKRPEIYVRDPSMCWPDGLSFSDDGRLYFYCSQINRCSWFSETGDQTSAPFSVYRVKPLYQPLIGNSNPFTSLRERFSREPKD